jgi:hypothetical protein
MRRSPVIDPGLELLVCRDHLLPFGPGLLDDLAPLRRLTANHLPATLQSAQVLPEGAAKEFICW